MTRNGIFYDLSKSPFYKTVGKYTFIFSSLLHLNKFSSGYLNHRIEFNSRLLKRYGFPVEFNSYADLFYYSQKESRGFLVYNADTGEYITCKEKVVLSGEKMM